MSIIILVHIAVAVLMSFCILLQHRASGLSATFGGSGATIVQRRGAEKLLFRITVWLSIIFFVLSVARWYI